MSEIDNPAQRITDDTKNLAEGLNDTFNLLVTNPIRILGFSVILYFLDITCNKAFNFEILLLYNILFYARDA